MQVKMSKTFTVAAPVAQVWDFMNDIERVSGCVPGASYGGALEENRHNVTMTVKVGPIKSGYAGEVTVQESDSSTHQIRISGRGTDMKGKGGATMEMIGAMQSLDNSSTEVTGDSVVTITGVLAQFGSRMIEDVSNQMFEQFTSSLRSKLEGASGVEEGAGVPAGTDTISGVAVAATALRGAIGRLVSSFKKSPAEG